MVTTRHPDRQVEIEVVLSRAKEFLGSDRHVRLFSAVYDTAACRQVASKCVNKMVHLSLQADDLVYVWDQAAFDFARVYMLSPQESGAVLGAFRPGTRLNAVVVDKLERRGLVEEARTCTSPERAAAHGFAFWCNGELDVAEPRVEGLFKDLRQVFNDCVRWMRKEVFGLRLQSVQDVFEAFSSGRLAQERLAVERDRPRC